MEDHLSPLFKALSHPIRRRILDILKDAPSTTGELNDQFPEVSRYAIMKHLTALEEGNLILSRRKGKYRVNFLNAVPLQEMHNRWVGKYMERAASSLLNVKTAAEDTGGDKTMKPAGQNKVFQIEQETLINAPRNQVFKALTEKVESWWEFRIAPEGKPSTLSLDPVPGGQFLEKWEGQGGAVWGNVYYVNAPEEIRIQGHLGMQGAVNSAYTYRLTEEDGTTSLQLSHTASGLIEEEWEDSHRKGWEYLLGTLLKNFIEEQ
ncbi:helix-turn-helix domain-containing protein [Rossellomorea vietnamensis]|uniref:Helix-turn-helix domain-containing protein n=1 Tax=Rossellomorea vietnamensis TaxID=218284 RepID=A0A5D4KIC8_9BACI|nr:SRPBCC domain-containing protein [Rossellomorea vietnamensis]TYR76958.1 helix-turn-helix domain-containing protein [Rossellomorea vietnamensis]